MHIIKRVYNQVIQKWKAMLNLYDQTGRLVQILSHPRRIISLVPSLTELLFDLGLDQEIVGVTHYCISPPEEVASRVKVGGIYQLDFQLIDSLQPDLIVANKEENDRQEVLRLQEQHPVYVSDIHSLQDAFKMIADLGILTDRIEAANQIITEIERAFSSIKPQKTFSVAYLIWKDPFRVVGGNTFINDLLKRSGFDNVFQDQARYPQVSPERIGQAQVILLSSEPYPFNEQDVIAFSKQFPASQVFLVDGTIFAWYGSRLRHTPGYINQLLKKIK